jgi:cytidylate kinase
MIISICGDPGSGKTSVAKLLSKGLGLPWYSMGDLRGKIASDRGITIDELNRLGIDDPSSDRAVDDLQKTMGETDDDFIIEGRLSWHFIPRSFKVLLRCRPDEAARRIFLAKQNREQGREDERQYESVEEVKTELLNRVASDAERYLKHYGIKMGVESDFDLVLDTTEHPSPDITTREIIAEAKKRGLLS